MSGKKDYSGALRKTVTAQKQAIDERFAKADSVLLGKASPAPAAAPDAPVRGRPKVAPPPVVPPTEEPKVELVIRDTFSMPPGDHGLIEQLRVRAAREGRNTNKSEVVRAGLHALSSLAPAQLTELLRRLEQVKPGRK